jgi:hypothetical protein
MLSSTIPVKFAVPFASAAPAGNSTYPVPTTPQTGGLASLPTGFTAVNFTPVAAGGIPPWGKDMNGILQQTTAWLQWIQAGGGIAAYDAAFQTLIGGYFNGSMVRSVVTVGTLWISTIDNNTSNPDATGAGWVTLASIILNNAALTGNPTAPLQPVNSNNTSIANTNYADRSAANAAAAAQANAEAYALSVATTAMNNAEAFTRAYADPLGAAASAQANAIAASLQKIASLSDGNIPQMLFNLGFTGDPGVQSINIPNSNNQPFILKFGSGLSSGNGALDTLTLPSPFSNGCLWAIAVYVAASIPTTGNIGAANIAGDAAHIHVQDTAVAPHGYFWAAIGF